MSGVVYFKFKSAISPDSVTFDGSFISVAELKNLIAARKGFGQDARAELILTNPSTKQDYTTDTQQIPRQTTVHVRRVPTSKPKAIQAAAAAPVATPSATLGAATGQSAQLAQPATDEFGAELYSQQAPASADDGLSRLCRAAEAGDVAGAEAACLMPAQVLPLLATSATSAVKLDTGEKTVQMRGNTSVSGPQQAFP